MARNVINIQSYLDTKLGTEPFLVLRVWWNYNLGDIAYYAERKIKNYSLGQLMSVSGLDTIVKANFYGSSSEAITVKLADIDGAIKSRLNTRDIHKIYCFLYQAYAEEDSINESDMALLFQGQISSPIVWDELNRHITFDIVGELEVNETGFSLEQSQLKNLPPESVGKTIPIVFGAPLRVPAIKISSTLKGTVALPINKISVSELQALYELTKHLIEPYIAFENAKDLYEQAQAPYYNVPNTEHYINIINEMNKIKSEIEGFVHALITRIPDSVDDIRLLADAYFWYQYNIHFYNIYIMMLSDANASLAYWQKKIDERPGEVKHNEQCQKNITRLQEQITQYQAQIDTYLQQMEYWEDIFIPLEKKLSDLAKVSFNVDDGEKFPQFTDIVIKVNNARLQGKFNKCIFTAKEPHPFLPTYTNIKVDERLNEDNPTEFWLEDEDINLEGMFCFIQTNLNNDVQKKIFKVTKQIGKLCYIKPILWKRSKVGDKYLYDFLFISKTNVPEIKEASPVILSQWIDEIDQTAPVALTGLYHNHTKDKGDQPWYIDVGDTVELDKENQDSYVCNQVPSTYIHEVMAYRTINGKRILTSVPKSYFTIYYSYRLGNMYTTLIVLKKELKNFHPSWDEGIYVTLQSTLSSNVAYIIKWLIESYTRYTVDIVSFMATANFTENYPCNFALTERHNIINLIEEIAWQARCIVYIYNNVVYLRYISRLPASYESLITESDIDIESVIVTYTSTEDIITKLRGRWRLSYTQEHDNEVIVRNKTPKYGVIEQDYDFFIYNNEALVRKSLAFWLIRYSNSWKIIKFKTYLRNLHLRAYDLVRLDFSRLNPLGKQTSVYGYVLSAAYNHNDGTITLEIWTSIRAGENFTYPLTWPSNAGGYAYPTIYDLYAGGASDPYANVLANGGEQLGLEYGTTVHDTGPVYLDDSYDYFPESNVEGRELVDYSLRVEHELTQVDPVRLDINKVEIYDSKTGLSSNMSTLFSVTKGIPQVPIGEEQSGDLNRLQTALCLKKDALVVGDYYKDDNTLKKVMAPIDMDYDKDYRTWMLRLEKTRPFLAKITGATSDGQNVWKYSWIEVIPQTFKVMSESGIPYQRSGNSAYNLIELINNGIGVEGNSVNHSGQSFPSGFSMKSAGAGEPITVVMYPIFNKTGLLYYYFQYENADDGSCD